MKAPIHNRLVDSTGRLPDSRGRLRAGHCALLGRGNHSGSSDCLNDLATIECWHGNNLTYDGCAQGTQRALDSAVDTPHMLRYDGWQVDLAVLYRMVFLAQVLPERCLLDPHHTNVLEI